MEVLAYAPWQRRAALTRRLGGISALGFLFWVVRIALWQGDVWVGLAGLLVGPVGFFYCHRAHDALELPGGPGARGNPGRREAMPKGALFWGGRAFQGRKGYGGQMYAFFVLFGAKSSRDGGAKRYNPFGEG